MEYHASPSEDGHVPAWHGVLHPLLRPVDAAIAFLQRLRNRIETPPETEESEPVRRSSKKDRQPAAAPEAAAPARRRLPRAVAVLLLLAGAAALGSALSYRLLSDSLNTDQAVIEDLRDDVARLDKDAARIERDKAKYQKQMYEDEKTIRSLQQEIADYRSETETLREQLAAAKAPARGAAPAAESAGRNSTRRAPPQKSGVCATGTANTAADLTRCIEAFNRK